MQVASPRAKGIGNAISTAPDDPHDPCILKCKRLVAMASPLSRSMPARQSLRRWGNSLGIRLPAAIARQAHLQEDQDVELSVVEDGVLIRAVSPRLSLEDRLAAFNPSANDPVERMDWQPVGTELIP
jgi:antitoxin MazE